MIIRAAQMEAMASLRETEFCRQLCVELRREVPSQTAHLTGDALLSIVKDAFEKTKVYGIEAGDGIRRFVKLAVLISPDFCRHPDVGRFLRMPDLDGNIKIKLLSQLVAQELQNKVA